MRPTLPLLLVFCASCFAQQPARVLTAADYAHAEKFMTYNTTPLVFGTGIRPNWLPGDRFWYRVTRESGSEFILVDPAKGTRAPAFDHAKLAAALSTVANAKYEAGKLPFQEITLAGDGSTVSFSAAGKGWKCTVSDYQCAADATAAAAGGRGGRGGRGGGGRGGGGGVNAAQSPDKKKTAFIRDYNLCHSDPDPVKERKPQWVAGVGTASTAKATAVLAQAARVFKKFDPAFALTCAKAARAGFAFLEKHSERILVDGKGSDQPLWDDSTEYPESGARFTAAVEMYRSFRAASALASVRSLLSDPETQPAKFVEGGWPNLSRFGFMGLVSDKGVPADLQAEAKARLLAAVETQRPQIEKDGYLCATTPKGYYWGANSNLLEKAHEMAFALRLDPTRVWLREAARDQWHWILGRNPNGYSMVTRVGKGPDRIYSMEWGHADPPVPGYLIGGPNSSEFGFLAPFAPAKALLWDNPKPLSSGLPAHSLWHWEQPDLWDGGFLPKNTWDNGWWAVTEPDIYYNAALVLVATEMQVE